jgi:hypothetical protein
VGVDWATWVAAGRQFVAAGFAAIGFEVDQSKADDQRWRILHRRYRFSNGRKLIESKQLKATTDFNHLRE